MDDVDEKSSSGTDVFDFHGGVLSCVVGWLNNRGGGK